MAGYVLRRLLLALLTVFLVSLIAFSMINALPGDVVAARLADAPQARPELIAKLRKDLGLDRPWPIQYLAWVGMVLRGSLGKSLWSERSVNQAIKDALPATLEIALLAMLVSTVVALTFGTLAAVYQDGIVDHITRFISISALAVPDFWLGTLFIVFASRWFDYVLPLRYSHPWQDWQVNLQLAGIAAVMVGLRLSGSAVRLMRSTTLEVLRQDYMRTARAKGLTERKVIVGHGVRNAMLPVITILGSQFATLIAGTVVIENLFSIPGMGQLLLLAVRTRDFTMVQGIIFVYGAILVLVNLVVDLAYAYLDPRIRYA